MGLGQSGFHLFHHIPVLGGKLADAIVAARKAA